MSVSVEDAPEVHGAPRRKVDVRRKPVFRAGGRILGYGGGKLAVRTDFLHAVIDIRRIRCHQRQVGSDCRRNVIHVFPKHPADEVFALVRRQRCGRNCSSTVSHHDFVDDRHAVLVEEPHIESHRAFWRVRKRKQPFRIGADIGRDNRLDGREGELTGTCEYGEVGDIGIVMDLVEIARARQIRLHVRLRMGNRENQDDLLAVIVGRYVGQDPLEPALRGGICEIRPHASIGHEEKTLLCRIVFKIEALRHDGVAVQVGLASNGHRIRAAKKRILRAVEPKHHLVI